MGRWFFGCPAFLSGPRKDGFPKNHRPILQPRKLTQEHIYNYFFAE